MSPSRESRDETGWMPIVMSMSLFLVTAATVQFVQTIAMVREDRSQQRASAAAEEDDDVDTEDMETLRRWYRNRRVHDRLSYENIYDSMSTPKPQAHGISLPAATTTTTTQPLFSNQAALNALSSSTDVNNASLTVKTSSTTTVTSSRRGLSEWDIQRLRQKQQQPPQQEHSLRPQKDNTNNPLDYQQPQQHSPSMTLGIERGDSFVSQGTHQYPQHQQQQQQQQHPNADYDFHPKNRNWRHFEHYHEKDLIQRRRQQQQRNQHQSGDEHIIPTKSTTTRSNNPQISNSSYRDDRPEYCDYDKRKNVQDDDDDDDDDEEQEVESTAKSISSDGSQSSEEEFVWMPHLHKSKTSTSKGSAIKTTLETATTTSSSTTMTSTPEQAWRVPSFLSIFNEPETNGLSKSDEVIHCSSNGSTNYPGIDVPKEKVGAAISCAQEKPPKATFESQEFDQNNTQLPVNSASYRERKPKTKIASSSFIPLALRWIFNRDSHNSKTNHSSKDPDLEPVNQTSELATDNHRQLRTQYNAAIMPEKVILLRHGQSMGNIDETLYSTIPDNAMPLTKLGWEQARESGKILRNKIISSGEPVHFIVSPYVRTVETFHGLVSAWCDPKDFNHIADKEKRIKAWYRRLMELGLTWNEDSRIREQDFGNYQDPETIRKAKRERHRFGVFYYRFPYGESASDVFDRVSTFLDSLWRSFEVKTTKQKNYVIVAHGISIRVLLARYFRYTIDQFNILANPRNCEMIVLGHNGSGRLELQGRCALELDSSTSANATATTATTGDGKTSHEDDGKGKEEPSVKGYTFHKRLRILPKQAIRKVKIRISPDD